MLVLTRKKFQRVIIGDSIEVKVLEVRGGKVKLGFQCPPEISIRREEIDHLANMRSSRHPAGTESECLLAAN